MGRVGSGRDREDKGREDGPDLLLLALAKGALGCAVLSGAFCTREENATTRSVYRLCRSSSEYLRENNALVCFSSFLPLPDSFSSPSAPPAPGLSADSGLGDGAAVGAGPSRATGSACGCSCAPGGGATKDAGGEPDGPRASDESASAAVSWSAAPATAAPAGCCCCWGCDDGGG